MLVWCNSSQGLLRVGSCPGEKQIGGPSSEDSLAENLHKIEIDMQQNCLITPPTFPKSSERIISLLLFFPPRSLLSELNKGLDPSPHSHVLAECGVLMTSSKTDQRGTRTWNGCMCLLD